MTKEEKIHMVMHEFEQSKLKDSHGKLITDKDQALAVAISEAKEYTNAENVRKYL